MDYLNKFKSVTTIEELFDFKQSIFEEAERLSSVSIQECNKEKWIKNQSEINEANYYLRIIEARIDVLIKQGFSLDKINTHATSPTDTNAAE